MTAETWWSAPAQGFGAAFLVGCPVAGFPEVWLLFAASVVTFVSVDTLFRRRSGLILSGPAGPHGLVLAFVLAGGFGLNVMFAFVGLSGWGLVVAAVTGVITTLAAICYDHSFAVEVRRAG